MYYFAGSNIDIHAGGIDLRFPHHENEEAQSCVYHGTPQWVNYWIHTGHLSTKNAEKMSKSLKNTISIQELLQKNPPEVFRMACIMSTYNSNMEYGEELLATAKNTLKMYHNFLESCVDFRRGKLKSSINPEILIKKLITSHNEIRSALCDDFNTPKVLKILNELISVTNSMLYSTSSQTFGISSDVSIVLVQKLVHDTLEIFGINFESKSVQSEDFVEIMNILSEFRQDVRVIGLNDRNMDLLKMCDNVRDRLKNVGISLKDFKNTASWNKNI